MVESNGVVFLTLPSFHNDSHNASMALWLL